MVTEKIDKNKIIRAFFESTISFAIINTTILILGVFLVNRTSNVWIAIGTSLIASSIVAYGTIWLRYIKTEEEKLLSNVKNYGLRKIHSQRALVNIYEKLLETSNRPLAKVTENFTITHTLTTG